MYFQDAELEVAALPVPAMFLGVEAAVFANRHELQVAQGVIFLVLVFVVNNLFWTKKPAEGLLHYQPMLKDITLRVGVWVCRCKDAVVVAGSHQLSGVAHTVAGLAACVAGALGMLGDKLFAAHQASFFVSFPSSFSFGRPNAKPRAIDALLRNKAREAFTAVQALLGFGSGAAVPLRPRFSHALYFIV